MKQFSIFCIALLLTTFTLSAFAQQVYKGQINVTQVKMQQQGDSMKVEMELDLNNLKINRNRYLTLTPTVSSGDHSKELGDVLINGGIRSKSYKRSIALDKTQLLDYQPSLVTKSSNKDKLHYSYTVVYEAWMKDAHLDVKEVLCGCGGNKEEISATRLIDQPKLELPPVYNVQPQYAYLKPQAEITKARGDQFELYLNFPVNKTDILPKYMDNADELAQLQGALEKINKDSHLDVQKINIIGYASPEGAVANNAKLSKGRAEALKTRLISQFNYPAKTYTVVYGGENWDGLKDVIEASDMNDKNEILTILNNTTDVTTRKNKLKAYKKGATYNQLLKEIYPGLRKVVLDVQYNVAAFNIEEAKQTMKTRPHLLSPAEMYDVANTYAVGSSEYNNTIETAAKEFPKDKATNLNAASVALAKNDVTQAESFMKKADPTTPEYANSMGILYLLKGDLTQAKSEFEKASSKGLAAAKYNLQEVKKNMK